MGIELLRSLSDQGTLKPDDPVRRGAYGEWCPAWQVTGLFSARLVEQTVGAAHEAAPPVAVEPPLVAADSDFATPAHPSPPPPRVRWNYRDAFETRRRREVVGLMLLGFVAAISVAAITVRQPAPDARASASRPVPAALAANVPQPALAQLNVPRTMAVSPPVEEPQPIEPPLLLPVGKEKPESSPPKVDNPKPQAAEPAPEKPAPMPEPAAELKPPAQVPPPVNVAQANPPPAAAAQPPAAAPPAAAPDDGEVERANVEQYVDRLRNIARLRQSLVTQRAALVADIQRLNGELAAGKRAYEALEGRANDLRRQLARARLELTSIERENQRRRRSISMLGTVRQIDEIELLIERVRARQAEVQSQSQVPLNSLQAAQVSMQKLYGQAEQLRLDLLLLGDPGGMRTRAELQAGVEVLTEWVDADGNDHTALVTRGLVHSRLGDTAAAEADFEQALALFPDKPDPRGPPVPIEGTSRVAAHVGLGALLEARGDKAGKLQIDRALRLDANDPFFYLCRGVSLWSGQEYPAAERTLKKFLDLAPDQAEGHRLLGLLYASCPNGGVRDSKRALTHARRACELTQQNEWSCLDALAAAQAEAGQFVEAVVTIQQAAALTSGEHRQRCEARRQQYLAEQPLRLEAGPQ